MEGELSADERDNYVGLHSLDEAIALYSFDRRLRLSLLDAIERIEVAVRVQAAHVYGRRGPLAYLDRNHASSYGLDREPRSHLTNLETFFTRNQELVLRSSEVFAAHIRNTYDGYAPIWIAVECWDFGMLSAFYPIMPLDDQIEVASHFQVPNYAVMANWLQSIGHLRNACAHHQRLFRKTFVQTIGIRNTKKLPGLEHLGDLHEVRKGKLYPHLCATKYLMRAVAPDSYWPTSLLELLSEFPAILNSRLSDYGFPDDWQDLEFWTVADSV
jgi:abortive infection bacteriophage resistance protein